MSNLDSTARADRNKSNYLKAKDAFNEKDIDLCVSFYASDHQIMSRPSPKGRQAIQTFFEESHQTWPDIKIVVEHAVAEDNWVMGRSVTTATHTKAVLGVMPTQKQIETTFWDLHRFNEGGLIAETWNLMDTLAIMRQLDILPEPK
ncbi:MAG: ester cyclase [Gemmatimonadales bacterium]